MAGNLSPSLKKNQNFMNTTQTNKNSLIKKDSELSFKTVTQILAENGPELYKFLTKRAKQLKQQKANEPRRKRPKRTKKTLEKSK